MRQTIEREAVDRADAVDNDRPTRCHRRMLAWSFGPTGHNLSPTGHHPTLPMFSEG